MRTCFCALMEELTLIIDQALYAVTAYKQTHIKFRWLVVVLSLLRLIRLLYCRLQLLFLFRRCVRLHRPKIDFNLCFMFGLLACNLFNNKIHCIS